MFSIHNEYFIWEKILLSSVVSNVDVQNNANFNEFFESIKCGDMTLFYAMYFAKITIKSPDTTKTNGFKKNNKEETRTKKRGHHFCPWRLRVNRFYSKKKKKKTTLLSCLFRGG